MRTTRLYYPETLTCGTSIELGKTASAHLVRVLRAREGYPVILFNGNGFQYNGELIDASPQKSRIKILSEQAVNRESPLKITLIQGIARNDRMELCLQKATELGVYRIIPVICNRSNLKLNKDRMQKKLTHWQNVISSACEQSGRNFIPHIEPPQNLADYISITDESSYNFFLHPQTNDTLKSFQQQLKTPITTVSILIGPEGGLNNDEVQQLTDRRWRGIKMGPRILRTETAGPAAITALQLISGDF